MTKKIVDKMPGSPEECEFAHTVVNAPFVAVPEYFMCGRSDRQYVRCTLRPGDEICIGLCSRRFVREQANAARRKEREKDK